LRVIVVGMGVQGAKRQRIAGADLVTTVDPILPADYRSLKDVSLDSFDAALCCTPDGPKFECLEYLLTHKKHALVEKPLFTTTKGQIKELEDLAQKNNVVCYTAYNHRFEPHFMKAQEVIESGKLGKIYSCRMFYGNGTARLVRDSAWRDQGSGVIHDLGSHLLDTLLFFFGESVQNRKFNLRSCQRFENKSPDYAAFSSEEALPRLDCEMTMVSWCNSFYCDIYGEKGSLHIDTLCKWGPSTITFRERILPSGKPNETSETLIQSDPTWESEYAYFKKLCATKDRIEDLSKDLYLLDALESLEQQMTTKEPCYAN